jgi:hypothetical protein
MYRRAEYETIHFATLGTALVYNIVKNTLSELVAGMTGDAAADRLIANPEKLRVNALPIQCGSRLTKGGEGAALLVWASVDE